MQKENNKTLCITLKSNSLIKKNLKIIKAQRYLLILLIIPIIHIIIFQYVPIYGIILAFREWSPTSVFGAEWVGLKYFRMIFSNNYIYGVLKNTIILSVLSFITSFPITIIFALLVNELKVGIFKKVSQSISYLPTFISWVVVAGLVQQVLSPSRGIYGFLCDMLKLPKSVLLAQDFPWIIIFLISGLWKGIGYGAVVYLACISGINPELYQAASLDGASRFQYTKYITLPGIQNVIIYTLIFASGSLLTVNFDAAYNLMNTSVMQIADVIDIYILRIGIQQGQYSLTTAIGLLRNIITIFLIVITNSLAKRYSEFALW